MDSGRQVHTSIKKGLSIHTLKKCVNCCTPSRYHCPICSPVDFNPTHYLHKAENHMKYHLKRAVSFEEYTILICGLQCRKLRHYHCLYCSATLIKKRDFTDHLLACRHNQQKRAEKSSQLQTEASKKAFQTAPLPTPGESNVLSNDIELKDDSEEITIISDTDDQDGQGASSSQSVTPVIPKSNELDTVDMMRRSTEPEPSKCDRTVQTNLERPQDCDEFYFMNLVKMFKKLSPQKKSVVRMKIERLLFEAEFE
ncbi:uncharacterized protein [Pagrus major]|uniref:uncharacterized protein isoform X2 n=1 Tax=Pagrus major TaxID=143350 RepID=UPI003CC8938B